jgi:hypothetical protein
MKSKIISELYLRPDIDKLCKRRGKNWSDDLKSEAFLKLCEMPEELFNKKLDQDQLIGWLINTIITLSKKDSKFDKNIKGKPFGITICDLDHANHVSDDTDTDNTNENNIKDLKDDYCPADLIKGINSLEWFHRDIVEKYLVNDNKITQTGKAMDINREYVGKLLKESKELLKHSLRSNIGN